MLLSVKNLSTEFPVKKGIVKAVEDVSFDVDAGEILAIVGESGSGKSVTSLSVMGFWPSRGVAGGSMEFEGKDLVTLSEREYRELRGNDMAMIFQEPMTSLNPVYRVGKQIVEAIRTHENVSKKEARERAIDMLRKVGIPSPEKRIDDYPHQMSGGMRQRVMIAMALSCNPKLLIADEPTTALDVTIQAQILDLLRRLRDDTGMAVLLITHDLGVVSETADPRGGHVLRPGGGGEPRVHAVRPPDASLHAGPAEVNPPPGGRRLEALVHDQGHGAEPAGDAPGLPLLRPVRLLHGHLPREDPEPGGRGRLQGAVLPLRGRRWPGQSAAAIAEGEAEVRMPTPRRRATWRRPRRFWRARRSARRS